MDGFRRGSIQCLGMAQGFNGPVHSRLTTSTSPTLSRSYSREEPGSALGATSYFPDAHDFHISTMNINNSTVNHVGHSKSVIDYLEPHIAHGAAHSSAERCDAPKCHPDTRRAVQEEIVGWITYGDGDALPKRMMWLSGPAGAGKTAIAGSVAEICQARALLGATFFFSSHLAEHPSLHAYKTQLLEALHLYPTIFQKRLKEQAECLLLRPFTTIRCQDLLDRFVWPKVIIIDGLDEVQAVQLHDARRETVVMGREDDADQLEILNVLLSLAKHPAFPFCIFVASRPERAIENFFSSAARDCTLRLFLDSKYEPDVDIERFLCSRFVDVRRRYGISESTWPGQPVIDLLIEMSSGQFIVPAVVLRYVESGPPQRQLDEIIKLGRAKTATNNPFAMLDAVYTHIFDRSPDPLLAANWIRCIASFRALGSQSEGNSLPSFFWKHFLEDTEGEFSYILTPLLSLLSLPPSDDRRSPITLYHKSLTDFLSSKVRCGRLYSDEKSWRSFAAGRCVLVLKSALSIHQSNDWMNFTHLFLCASPLFQWNMRPGALAPFLGNLCEDSKAELADCDVAWWTRYILTDDRAGAGNSILKSDGPLDLDFLAAKPLSYGLRFTARHIDTLFSSYRHPQNALHPSTQMEFITGPPEPDGGRFSSRSNKYYCEVVVFEVEGTLYRVLKQWAMSWFSRLAPSADDKSAGNGETDENPIRLSGCTKSEFEVLLELVIPSDASEIPTLSKDEWIGVLKLGSLWVIPKATALAIEKLSALQMSPIEKVQLGKTYAVPSWLKDGYTKLLANSDSYTTFEEYRVLGLETMNRILLAKLKLKRTAEIEYIRDTRFHCLNCYSTKKRDRRWTPITVGATKCTVCYSVLGPGGVVLVDRCSTSRNPTFQVPGACSPAAIDQGVEGLFGEEIREAERRSALTSTG
ncbi:hypothetical protein NMY22_g6736 [Coprinellus aureogranulatus]|nr:hypothetical protein NMY22_g6736 [Coprinellus aureogranulatus]